MEYNVRTCGRLIAMGIIILSFTIIRQWQYENWNLQYGLSDFMGSCFIMFATFKLIHLSSFVEAYRIYDSIAQKNTCYAYAYPFIEFFLGIAFITRLYPIATNFITLILMLISSIGVIIELYKKKQITCACIYTVFKLPMTYVTLMENCVMSVMALIALITLLS
jgi:hypothetical protein